MQAQTTFQILTMENYNDNLSDMWASMDLVQPGSGPGAAGFSLGFWNPQENPTRSYLYVVEGSENMMLV